MTRKIGSKLVCPLCYEIGYLVKGQYLRIVHNYKKKAKWKTRFCYIGTPKNAINKLKKILKMYPRAAKDSNIKRTLGIIAKHENQKPDPKLAELILDLRKFSKNLGEFHSTSQYESRRLSKCPHCAQKLAIWTKRIGSLPSYHYHDIWLEKWSR